MSDETSFANNVVDESSGFLYDSRARWSFEEFAKTIRLRRYENSFYALIASYMDESFDPASSGIFAVGGLLGRGVALFELERKWENLCNRSDIRIAYFKASQCERATGEFAKFVATPGTPTPEEKERLGLISHEFIRLINEESVIIQGIGVVQEDFYQIIKDHKARSVLGDSPYRLAYDLAMIQCAWAMKTLEQDKLKSAQPFERLERDYVSFVCDENEQYSKLAHEAYGNLKRNNPHAAEYMATYSEADDKACAVMQAADAATFEIRRALNLALGQWKGELRKQFNAMADARKVFLIQHANKENLLRIVETHEPGEPYKLDGIMGQEFNENLKIEI